VPRRTGYQLEASGDQEGLDFSIDDALRILKKQPESNLGWRLALEIDKPPFFEKVLCSSVDDHVPLIQLLPDEYVRSVQERADRWQEEERREAAPPVPEHSGPTIKIVSFEGSKGLSASHVFIVGLHEGDLPRNPAAVEDLEVCKLLVALTRTRKQCHILYTRRWGAYIRRPSAFLSWIRRQRKDVIRIDSRYWASAR
jgi:superfamily I DNA/RNA helicase